jgi:hypothetical protein
MDACVSNNSEAASWLVSTIFVHIHQIYPSCFVIMMKHARPPTHDYFGNLLLSRFPTVRCFSLFQKCIYLNTFSALVHFCEMF